MVDSKLEDLLYDYETFHRISGQKNLLFDKITTHIIDNYIITKTKNLDVIAKRHRFKRDKAVAKIDKEPMFWSDNKDWYCRVEVKCEDIRYITIIVDCCFDEQDPSRFINLKHTVTNFDKVEIYFEAILSSINKLMSIDNNL